MAEPDFTKQQARAESKSSYPVLPIGTMANVSGIAANISGLTPAQRAARDA